jgi:predicted transposase YbfD/YdcC
MEKHTGFDKLIVSLAQLEDPRGGFSISYSLNEILFLTVSSLLDNPETCNKKIREHWQIENQLHWTMDVIFDEDASRKRSRNSAQNFAIIRRMVLDILKNNAEK